MMLTDIPLALSLRGWICLGTHHVWECCWGPQPPLLPQQAACVLAPTWQLIQYDILFSPMYRIYALFLTSSNEFGFLWSSSHAVTRSSHLSIVSWSRPDESSTKNTRWSARSLSASDNRDARDEPEGKKTVRFSTWACEELKYQC